MALIACFECGNKISTQAKTCPYCGIEDPYEKGLEHEKKKLEYEEKQRLERNKGCMRVFKVGLFAVVGLFGVSILLSIIVPDSPANKADEAWKQKQREAKQNTTKKSAQDNTPKWVAHDYTIISNSDVRFGVRIRRSIRIVSTTAITQGDRIATLMDAVKMVYWETYPKPVCITAFLAFSDSDLFPVLAKIEYAHDGCGWTGDDCTGQLWTEAKSTAFQYSDDDKEFMIAYKKHRPEFMEPDGFGGELPNMQRFDEFLGNKFNKSKSEIINWKIWVSKPRMEDIYIPKRLRSRISDY